MTCAPAQNHSFSWRGWGSSAVLRGCHLYVTFCPPLRSNHPGFTMSDRRPALLTSESNARHVFVFSWCLSSHNTSWPPRTICGQSHERWPNSSRTRRKTCAILIPGKRKRCVHIHCPCIHILRIGCKLQEHSGDSNCDGGGNSMGTLTATAATAIAIMIQQ